ncbi:MAG: N-acetyl-gamma-glutamyl-phosphate reductase [Opitutia bacterium UBA7350]|nr:MAG: N-acetyl-gamma-glutamyl-phosphate reductase [Opitutae bacterium UBA7350]
MKVAVIGASGYSGVELVKILATHPQVELGAVTSRTLVGESVADAMPGLRHLLGEMEFESSDLTALSARDDLDLFFLALPHGVACDFAKPLLAAGKVVIDLSADFRLNSPALYESYYGKAHPAPELLEAAPYVLPELATGAWENADLIACPGCYPTSIQLPIVPLLKDGLIDPAGIVINSYSGVSGAGKKLAENFMYVERSESMVAYGTPYHRHLSEIEEQLAIFTNKDCVVQFNPHLAPMNRGISTTIVAKAKGSIEALEACWDDAYRDQPFIGLLPRGTFPDTKNVKGTNRADLAATYDERTGNFIIHSVIDNLLKGASGQAVQIMNLKYGFNQAEGLMF